MKSLVIGTHDGPFHCDEVLACTMLRLLPEYAKSKIVRSRKIDVLAKCDIVVDVGGEFDPSRHRYDHHQKGFQHSMNSLNSLKKWTTKLSSAGLIYAHFGRDVIGQILGEYEPLLVEVIYDKVYERFIEEVDACDNGISAFDGYPRYQVTTTLSNRVANLRPAWNDKDSSDYEDGFYRAMDIVQAEFVDRVKYFGRVWWPARELVAAAIKDRFSVSKCGRIILFSDSSCPFKEHLYDMEEKGEVEGDAEIVFAVFPDDSGAWRVIDVGRKEQGFVNRCGLLPEWRCLREDELVEVSGIENCIFVHANGFIGSNRTKNGAIEMALKSLEKPI